VQDRLSDTYVYYTQYQFAGNEVPNAVDLDGFETYRYANPKQALAEGFSSISKRLSNLVDRARFFFSNTTETSDGKDASGATRIKEIKVKASIGTNLSEAYEYVEANNSSKGYKGPLMKAEATAEVANGVKTEKNVNGVKVTVKTMSNGDVKVTTEFNGGPFSATVSTTTSPNGVQKNEVTASTGTSLLRSGGNVTSTTDQNGNTKVSIGVKGEVKVGDVKNTTEIGVTF
jgi:hypothetical protein